MRRRYLGVCGSDLIEEGLDLDTFLQGVRPNVDISVSLPYPAKEFSQLSRGICSCLPPSLTARKPP
jgi:hypothetical protein